MPVVNDFPGAYERIKAQAEDLARRLGIQKEIIYGFFNSTAHFPQTLGELEQWGNQVDPKYGVSRRDPATGAWRPIMPTSRNPDPRLTEQDRGGFNHAITNAEDSDLQRFQQVDPSGNVFGGSWDPSYNAAHPELGGQSGYATAQAGLAAPVRSASGDRISGTGPGMEFYSQAGNPYAPGMPQANPALAATWDAANPSSTGAPTPTSSGGSSGAVGGNVGANPATFGPAVDLANNAAQIWIAQKRIELDRDIANRLDEREKQRILLEGARDVWKKTYETALLTGRIDGQPTVDAATKRADTTGYYDEGGTGHGQAVLDAIQALRGNAQYQQADGAGKRAMEAAAIQQATGGAVSGAQAAQAVDRLRSMTAATGGMSSAQLVEGVLNQVAPGRATLGREKEQNATGLEALRLLASLRGPENAFAYANTLQNLPPAIRASIEASMARVGMAPRNPAQAGVLGDVGVGAGAIGTVPEPGAIVPSAIPAGIGPPTVGPGGGAAGMPTRAWGESRPGESYIQVEGPGNPSWEARNPQANPALGARPVQQPAWSPGRSAAGAQPMPQPAMLQGGAPNGTAASVNQFLPAPLTGGTAGAAQGAAQTAYQAANGAPAGTMGRLAVGAPAGTVDPSLSAGALGGNAPAFGPRTQPAGLTPGGQISPTDWNATNSYAKRLMLAGYEDQGQDKDAVMDAFRLSLPTAFGPRSGRMRAA